MTEHNNTRSQRLHSILRDNLAPTYLHIENESSRHQVPKDAQTHFKVTMVSAAFNGLRRIERHQLINDLMKSELQTGLHALSLALYTPEEWQKNPSLQPSPPCQHRRSEDS